MHKLLIQHLPPRVKDARKTPVSVVVLLYEGRCTRDFSSNKTGAWRLIAVDWSDMRTKTIQGEICAYTRDRKIVAKLAAEWFSVDFEDVIN